MTDRFLPTNLRRALERDIKEARRVAEEGTADAIRRLGVADPEAPAHLSDEGKAARRRLRAHARALGDTVTDGVHTVDHLIEAAAYAQWHRRLFARFLAERSLLRHPDHGVAVTLDEAEELAAEEGFVDGWSAAESYAARMLPAVFQPEDPVLSLTLAPEHALALRKLVLGIDAETFQAEDSLGWTYQFWRALEKERVNKAGEKIGARDLPAVTQLFTEPYMVKFLLHNTLGAWRAGRVLAERPELAATAANESALRTAVSPPGYEFDMLRFVREGEDGPWRPAAGTFPGWPQTSAEIRALDPCCGSGHFLTEMLAILGALRGDEEGLTNSQAVAAVLSDNLFGLELDGRCVQIAAFAVALTAWRIGGFQPFGPDQVHVAWVGAPPPLDRNEFVSMANGDDELRQGLAGLHDLFVRAPLLGSLIDPTGGDLMSPQRLGRIVPMLDRLVAKARTAAPERAEGAVAARGMADAAAILSRSYTLVATNVPFLGMGRQTSALSGHITKTDQDAKTDLATAMISRAFRLLDAKSTLASVTPQNWLFLGGYKKFRIRMLQTNTFNAVGALGSRAFETITGEVVNTALVIISKEAPGNTSSFFGIDGNTSKDVVGKRSLLISGEISDVPQHQQLGNPDSRVSVSSEVAEGPLLSSVAYSAQGIGTTDNQRFLVKFWEKLQRSSDDVLFQTSSISGKLFSGCHTLFAWGGPGSRYFSQIEELKKANRIGGGWQAGSIAWNRPGMSVNVTKHEVSCVYSGEKFDTTIGAIIPLNPDNLPAISCFLRSSDFADAIRKIDQGLSITEATLVKVPFDLGRWQTVAASEYPTGFPDPYSEDPTEWLFHGHPEKAEVGTQLHVALARLAGYRWPAESDPDMRLSVEARDWIAKADALPAADADGILPLAAVGAERPLADRLRDYLNVAIPGWDEARLVREADERIDKKVGKGLSLEDWLRDRAFRQHSALFHNRPLLWQVWDGQKDGFSAFLHYHRLDHAALQKLTYTLLGAWITRREAEKDERRVEAAKVLKQKLEAILEGEAPHDIFVRWKPLAQQPLGWNPDLDDGVRLNIRPWVTVGVLREPAPKGIKWGVDRGKDVASAPWFKLDKGERNNDRHTTLAEKQAARDAVAKAAKA